EYQAADKLIACTPGFKQNLANRGIDQAKLVMIYNWCDESSINIPEPNPTVAQELGFTNHFNIVFAGTMGVMQALDSIMDAAKLVAKEFPEVKFTFVGGGIEVDRLKSVSASMDNVQFLPQMPASEIGRVFANADVLLVHLKAAPIFEITVPSKIQAYLYAGKPILCGVRGDAAELVQVSGGGITFEPENAPSLVEAIRKLKEMPPSARSEMGLMGQQYYRSRLSFAKGVDQIEAVFTDVVRN
ncbi:MAG TPA: glycosyltransferase family 4 protein, partial [Pirellula sp.]|nr:glycosyltransferase family 4 protein [Pirellula sp.]